MSTRIVSGLCPALFALGAGLLVASGGLQAALIAHEPFDYADGTPLHGLAGGTGWLAQGHDTGPRPAQAGWAVQRARTDAAGYRIGVAAPPAGARFAGSTSHLVGGWDYLSVGRALDTAAAGAVPAWGDGELLGKPGQPIYIAALLRTDAPDASVFLNVHASRFASQVDRSRVSWGVFGNAPGAAGYWALRAGDGEVLRTDLAALPGEAALLLVKLEFVVTGAKWAGQASLWVNPTPGRALPPPAVGVETGDIRFHSLAAYLGAGPGGGALDEVRVGTTAESVLGAGR